MDHDSDTWLQETHAEHQDLKDTADAKTTVDMALGVLATRYHLPAGCGRDILRALSDNLGKQLPATAGEIIKWGLGQPLRPEVEEELQKLLP
ncbi:hypothetical protein [Streptomyces sp. NPDC048508]|uniref:hypothetical protein n=1 Tax=Streptomyces sp. NPDC048508 TaxID=3365561 RepID=UPI00371BE74B